MYMPEYYFEKDKERDMINEITCTCVCTIIKSESGRKITITPELSNAYLDGVELSLSEPIFKELKSIFEEANEQN